MAQAHTIHPNFKLVEVTATNGDISVTRSTYHNDKMNLELDPHTHPAWTNQAGFVNEKANEVASFNKRYAGTSNTAS